MTAYRVEDARGERDVAAADFPLALGGPEAAVQVSPRDGGPLAWLGLAEGEVFVQPAEGAAEMLCNGTPLASSRWLDDGDVLEVGSARVVVRLGAREARFAVREAEGEDLTDPPVIVAPPGVRAAGAPGDAPVRPVEFQPSLGGRRGRRRLRLLPLLALLALAALVAAAGFVFTARPVHLEIEPPPDRLEIEGGLLHPRLGERYLLRPGRYTLVAEKRGYQRLEVPLEVGRESPGTLRFRLERLPGLLHLTTVPAASAEVVVDGEPVGTTPLGPLQLSPGEHDLEVRAERYETFSTRVEIEGGGVEQALTAELVPAWAPVTFVSRPPGARLRLDGREVGVTPATVEVASGEHGFELLLARHKPHRGRLRVTAGEPQSLPPVTLEPSDGNLTLTSDPAEATVTVDGVYRGLTPLDLDLEPDRPHRVQVSKAGFEPSTRDVEVGSGESAEVGIVLLPREGEVTVLASPPDAELWVAGEPRGEAGHTLRLPAVPQEIEVRKPGWETARRTVTPLPGMAQVVEVTLERPGEPPPGVASSGAAPPVVTTSEGHELRRVEPGRFLMGASRREPGRRANEVQREVELTRPYYLGVHEVSNRQFRRFKPDHLSGGIGGYNLEIDHHPVVRVTWEEAAEYCNWLSDQEGLPRAYMRQGSTLVAVEPPTAGYRLPTEAEWAWAARFAERGGALKYPWGESLPVPRGAGNYADRTAAGLLPGTLGDYEDGYTATAPVDGFEPNALGFFNLGGNVAEWVHDLYAVRSSLGGRVERDPRGPSEGEFHVIRGSSWMHSTVTELRLTFRDYGAEARPDLGFRIARDAE